MIFCCVFNRTLIYSSRRIKMETIITFDVVFQRFLNVACKCYAFSASSSWYKWHRHVKTLRIQRSNHSVNVAITSHLFDPYQRTQMDTEFRVQSVRM